IMTQYPEGEPAYSPRLMEPKLSIINIPTTPTSAMNRAGTGLKNPALDQRMEYFDPKTRPQAILLDEDALLTAPWEVWRSTSTTVFAGLVGGMSQSDMNPLVAGDQRHAFSLAHNAYLKMKDSQTDRALRMDMALAAFLQNRAEDDGRRGFRVGTFMGNYAVSTALHIRYPAIGQGESTSVVQAHTIRLAQDVEWSPARQVCRAIGISYDGLDGRQMALAVADWLEEIYGLIGMPTRLRQLDVPKDDLSNIAKDTVKNFNANSGVRSAQEQIEDALNLLNAAW
ncbi:MAG: iron-containing alcohol dehydrogenase, partial [Alphaproteobacteria bacterium]|nr:iron-containing alcohol dehydrogenase [Alphaproteobacteria bacterium]